MKLLYLAMQGRARNTHTHSHIFMGYSALFQYMYKVRTNPARRSARPPPYLFFTFRAWQPLLWFFISDTGRDCEPRSPHESTIFNIKWILSKEVTLQQKEKKQTTSKKKAKTQEGRLRSRVSLLHRGINRERKREGTQAPPG